MSKLIFFAVREENLRPLALAYFGISRLVRWNNSLCASL
jgi:hypothetical protein